MLWMTMMISVLTGCSRRSRSDGRRKRVLWMTMMMTTMISVLTGCSSRNGRRKRVFWMTMMMSLLTGCSRRSRSDGGRKRVFQIAMIMTIMKMMTLVCFPDNVCIESMSVKITRRTIDRCCQNIDDLASKMKRLDTGCQMRVCVCVCVCECACA